MLAGLAAAILLWPSLAMAQTVGDVGLAPQGDGPAFPVADFIVRYRDSGSGLPPVEELLPLNVPLVSTATGYKAPPEGETGWPVAIRGNGDPALFHASALGAVARALLAELHQHGLMGVYVRPSPDDIDIREERDLRAAGDETLHLDVWVGRIQDVRTVALGSRIKTNWKIDNPAHRDIRKNSPLAPTLEGEDGTTDRIDRRELEDYLYALNRHPGRQVEAALAASADENGITLDYRVYEDRPWNVYVQSANTGTERTSLWQTRVGYENRQLTDRDDILSINYLNSGLNDVHSIQFGYDAPWFGARRADWMNPGPRESGWLKWMNRDKIPWWGAERLRWQVQGGWTRISSDVVELLPGGFSAVDSLVSDDWHAGGGLTYNAFQYRNFFVDLTSGIRFRGVNLDNKSAGNDSNVTLALFDMGLEFDRSNAYSAFFGRVVGEYASALGNATEIGEAFGGGLGRASTDPDWWVILFEGGINQYLEPLLFGPWWRDPATPRSSTLSHEISIGGRGQYAFDYRLIPQSSQVIGGLYSVRGFPQGVAVGDTVYIGSAEYRFHLPRSLPISRKPVKLPWVGDFRVAPQQVYGRPDWDLIFRGFIDAGKSIRNNPQLASGTELNQFLVGAGAGVEFVYKGNLTVRVDWAKGIHQEVDCDPTGDPGCQVARDEIDTDQSGKFYFLINGVW